MEFAFGPMKLSEKLIFKQWTHILGVRHPDPILSNHILLFPRRRTPSFNNLEPEEVMDLSLAIRLMINLFEKGYASQGTTVYFKNYSGGTEPADQLQQMLTNYSRVETLNHFHVHIIPRKIGDLANNDVIYREIESSDRNFLKFYTDKILRKDAITEVAIGNLGKEAALFRDAVQKWTNLERQMINF
jgi:bis(5'-adenosyl)-triphosphatase